MRSWTLAAVLVAWSGGIAGCRTGGSETIVQPTRDPVLADIPKPPGFVLVDDRSTAFATGQWRIAKCEYVGSMERDQLRRFYEQYMPQAQFELRQWNLEAGTLAMTFESPTEVCNIRLRPRGNRTAVFLEISPLAEEPIEPGPPRGLGGRPG